MNEIEWKRFTERYLNASATEVGTLEYFVKRYNDCVKQGIEYKHNFTQEQLEEVKKVIEKNKAILENL